MVAFRLLSRARESGLLGAGGEGGEEGLDDAYLNGTLRFLEGNREMSHLREKETRRFDAMSVVRDCSVAGVMAHAHKDGEFAATHLEIALRGVGGVGMGGNREVGGTSKHEKGVCTTQPPFLPLSPYVCFPFHSSFFPSSRA